ncbi:TetR/AcrR family transcriptional regulator [Streptomyces radicis]|uniref:TetR/AcrR family transcriptional regulator n=1 Tax=Streptomyces radicis TaxID=1750517 RepID=A0A3A9W973_9ACTN|nr:TetR/AcrR family transcriptional regulator [Streptomyces radicis]RKN05924.1 TetR/AcrR family transcriptional regulator [Streptomyces radicis]RKN17769.1 TetR/AcrR family transcriptional regulator [Streptomyces radicis]
MPQAEQAPGARRGPGRPRAAPKRHNGLSTREEILKAASALFGARGYEATSTRQIADSVGIKQATLYYHFADKRAILAALLSSTVTPALALARWLDARDLTPEVRLCALIRHDLDTLLRDRLDLHVLHRLPGLVPDDFAPAHAARTSLRDTYRRFGRAVLDALHPPDRADALARDLDLVFALVEAAVSQRQWGDEGSRPAYAASVVRGSLRLLGVDEARVPAIVASAAEALAAYPDAAGATDEAP